MSRSRKTGPKGDMAWSDKEHRIFKRYYVREGAKRVQERLEAKGFHRSLSAITNRAHTHMLVVGDVPGYIGVCEGAGIRSGASRYYRLLFQACHDGVLLELPTSRRKYLVPIEWMEKYHEDRMKRKV